MEPVKILNHTRGTVVGSRVTVARRWWERLRGYLGRPRPSDGEGLLLVPCSAVHMYGMRFPLDVVFIGPEGQVVEVSPGLAPGKRTPRIRGARYTLELPEGTIDATGTRKGDALAWMPLTTDTPDSPRPAPTTQPEATPIRRAS